MKLGKTHLVASLAMVAASIAYNVWVFTRPATAERSGRESGSARRERPGVRPCRDR